MTLHAYWLETALAKRGKKDDDYSEFGLVSAFLLVRERSMQTLLTQSRLSALLF